jgi:hypothetical protein
LGWPDAFLPFIAGHLNFDPHPVLDHDGIEGRRLLAYRDTDRFVTGHTGLIPLSVSADRLAHPAMRCAVIQAKIAREYGPQARDGSGRLAEVYPAASLKLWGIHARGYKRRGAPEAEKLSSAVADLSVKAPWLDLAEYRADLAASDDMFDALIASLTARAAAVGGTLRPGPGHAAAALTEGWIHLPRGGLQELTA